MNPLCCESVTDLLPDRLRDRLGEIERLAVDRHVERCSSCRAQKQLLQSILRARADVPAGLEARVQGAVAARAVPGRAARGDLAAAAAVVVALLTGGLVISQVGLLRDDQSVQDADLTADIQALRPDDPLLQGGPGFDRLSLEELSTLLAELDS